MRIHHIRVGPVSVHFSGLETNHQSNGVKLLYCMLDSRRGLPPTPNVLGAKKPKGAGSKKTSRIQMLCCAILIYGL